MMQSLQELREEVCRLKQGITDSKQKEVIANQSHAEQSRKMKGSMSRYENQITELTDSYERKIHKINELNLDRERNLSLNYKAKIQEKDKILEDKNLQIEELRGRLLEARHAKESSDKEIKAIRTKYDAKIFNLGEEIQAKKIEDNNLRSEMEEQLREVKSRLNMALDEKMETEKRLTQLEAEHQGCSVKLNSLEETNASLKKSLEEMELKNKMIEEELCKKTENMEKSEDTYFILNSQIKQLKANIEILSKSKEELIDVKSQFEMSKVNIRFHKRENSRLEQQLKEKEKLLDQEIQSNKELDKKWAACKDQLMDMEKQHSLLLNDFKKVEDSVQDKESCLSEAETKLSDFLKKITEQESEILSCREKIRTYESQLLIWEEKEILIKNLKNEVAQKSRKIESLEKNIALLKDGCEVLEIQIINFEKVLNQSFEDLKKANIEMKDLQDKLGESREDARTQKRQLNEERSTNILLQNRIKTLETCLSETSSSNSNQVQSLMNAFNEVQRENKDLHLKIATSIDETEDIRRVMQTLERNNMALLNDNKILKEEMHKLMLRSMENKELIKEAEMKNNELLERNEELKKEQQKLFKLERELLDFDYKYKSTLDQYIKLIDYLQSQSVRKKKKSLFHKEKTCFKSTPTSTVPARKVVPAGVYTPTPRRLVEERKDVQYLEKEKINLLKELEDLKNRSELRTIVSLSPKKTLKQDCILLKEDLKTFSSDLEKGLEDNASELRVKLLKGGQWVPCVCTVRKNNLAFQSGTENLGEFPLNPNTKVHSRLSTDLIKRIPELKQHFHTCLKIVTPTKEATSKHVTMYLATPDLEAKTTIFYVLMDHLLMLRINDLPEEELEIRNLKQPIEKRCLYTDNSPETLVVNVGMALGKNLYLLGCDQGLYSLKPSGEQGKKVRINGMNEVFGIEIIPSLGMVVFIEGREQELKMVPYRVLLACAEAAECSKPSMKSEPVAQNCLRNINVVKTGVIGDKTLIAAATKRHLYILVWDSYCFKVAKQKNTTEAITCLLFTNDSIMFGGDKFYEMDCKTFQIQEFVDLSDNSLMHTLITCREIGSFPMEILDVSECNRSEEDCMKEYLLCFPDIGIFVDKFGRRSRPEDIVWAKVPRAFMYRHPNLLVIHFSSVAIIHLCADSYSDTGRKDTNNESIIQMPSCRYIPFKNPLLLGTGAPQTSVLIRNLENHLQQIIELDAPKSILYDSFLV